MEKVTYIKKSALTVEHRSDGRWHVLLEDDSVISFETAAAAWLWAQSPVAQKMRVPRSHRACH
jgi:hypothetical protein